MTTEMLPTCPFYAHAMHRVPWPRPEWVMMPNPGSNQCALITDAHSPCILLQTPDETPDWAKCPRNPSLYIRETNQ